MDKKKTVREIINNRPAQVTFKSEVEMANAGRSEKMDKCPKCGAEILERLTDNKRYDKLASAAHLVIDPFDSPDFEPGVGNRLSLRDDGPEVNALRQALAPQTSEGVPTNCR